jgi:hypothetical protein
MESAARAIRTAIAGIDPGEVGLVVIDQPDPGTDIAGPLLDGVLCAQVVRVLLADNGLVNAVPFGVTGDAEAVARAIMAAEGISPVVVVTVEGPAAKVLA